MADIVDSATRSRMMSGIRGKNTKPEYHIRSLLHRNGFRFRLHTKDLPGKPDILLLRYHAVLFINGCFWHGHDCHLFRLPGTRTDFWETKIARNQENDQRAINLLIESDWRVASVWECAIRGKHRLNDAVIVEYLADWIRSDEIRLELRGISQAD